MSKGSRSPDLLEAVYETSSTMTRPRPFAWLKPLVLPFWNGGYRFALHVGEYLGAIRHRRFGRCEAGIFLAARCLYAGRLCLGAAREWAECRSAQADRDRAGGRNPRLQNIRSRRRDRSETGRPRRGAALSGRFGFAACSGIGASASNSGPPLVSSGTTLK